MRRAQSERSQYLGATEELLTPAVSDRDLPMPRPDEMITSGTGWQGQEVFRDTCQPPHTTLYVGHMWYVPPPTQEEEKNPERGENPDLTNELPTPPC